MIHLITGTPGSGKTLYAVSLITAYHKQNQALLEKGEAPRQIYSDIDGLDIEGVEPAPDDWRDTPDGSIIFYDEIQQRDAYKKAKGDNDIVNALQVHRHTGHDIYGITQFPILLHANFNAVVGLHWHLHRGWGLAAATVYQWAYCVTAPNTPSNKSLAENSFRFSYPKDLFQYYKSATVHTHKARIPKKFLLIVFMVLCGVALCYKLLFGTDNFLTNTIKGRSGELAKTDETAELPNKQVSDNAQPSDPVAPTVAPQIVAPKHTGILNPLTGDYVADINKAPANVVRFRDRCQIYNHNAQPLVNISNELCIMYADNPHLLVRVKQPANS